MVPCHVPSRDCAANVEARNAIKAARRIEYSPCRSIISSIFRNGCAARVFGFRDNRAMQYQQLGNTGVFVSRLCLGAMTFGGKGSIFEAIGALGQKETDELVGKSLDAGINFIDTANVYADGESEILVGKAMGARRKDVVLATKVFGRMGPG